MSKAELFEKLESLGDSVVEDNPLAAGILYVLAGLVLMQEEALLAVPAKELADILATRNKLILKNTSNEI